MLRRDERGQSLVLVVMSMVVIVLIAAVAIDVSQWFVKHHQAQVTADAAALAAANYMGHGGTSSTATTFATTYAARNGLPITGSNVDVETGPETVAVTVPTTGALSFAGISFGSGPAISARAVASWKMRDCGGGGSSCSFAYGADPVCSTTGSTTGVLAVGGTVPGNPNSPTTVNNGVTINKSGQGSSPAVTGEAVSNSNITTYTNGTQSWPAATAVYPVSEPAGTPTVSCSGPTQAALGPYGAAVVDPAGPVNSPGQFPMDYRNIYTSCSGGACTAGFPPYCTVDSQAATLTITTPASNAVYCDAGTGTTSDPSTWNGTINVSLSGNATFIAGVVNMTKSGNTNAGPAANTQLLAYGTECNASTPPPTTCPSGQTTKTSSPVITLSGGGGGTITGDSFAPAGVIDDYTSGSAILQGFLEGWDVVYDANGTVAGQGPQVSNGVFVGDYLIQ